MADIVISALPKIVSATSDDYIVINDGNLTTAIVSYADFLSSISGLETVGFADGSASSPSITFTSDTNVGIYKPAPDSWAVATNGIQRLVIDDGGRVGINQTSPASWFNGSNNLVVGDPSLGDNGITIASSTTDVGNISFADGTTGADTRRGLIRYDHTDDHMRFDTASFERMRITENGQIGIGEPAPTLLLELNNEDNAYIRQTRGDTRLRIGPQGSVATSGALIATETNGPLVFATNGLANTRLTIANDGISTFTNNVAIGEFDVTNAGVNGVRALASGKLQIQRQSSADIDARFEILQGTTVTTAITNDGNATFDSAVTAYRIDAGQGTGDGSTQLFTGRSSGGTPTSKIFSDGSAEFTDTVTSFVSSQGYAFEIKEGSTSLGGLYKTTSNSGYLQLNNNAGTAKVTINGKDGSASFNSVAVNGNINLTGAGTPGPELSTPATSTIALAPDGAVERIRVDASGAIGLSGANYGLDGQVLTSQGPGVAPAWVSVASGIPDISSLPDLP